MRLNAALTLIRAAALSAALFLLGTLVPVIGATVMLCAPAPLLIVTLGRPRADWRIAGCLALALAIIGLIAGPWQAAGFAVSFGLATLAIFILLRRQWAFEWVVLGTGLVMLLAVGTSLLLWAGSPAALAEMTRHTLTAATSHANEFYAKLGFGTEESKGLNARIVEITLRLIPGLGAIVAAATALFNLGLIWRWLGRSGVGYALFNGLTKWRAPEWVIWLLLATGFGLFVPVAPLKIAASNGFLFIAAVYFCQGLAIMAYYFQMLAMPVAARGIIYVITTVQPILAGLVCLAGIFDMWIDFRRLKPPSHEAGSLDDFF